MSAAARRERQEGAPLDRLVGAEFILRPTSQGEKHIFSSISLAHAPPARAVTIFGSSPTGAVDNEICGWGCYVYRSGSGDPGHVSGWAVDSDSPQSAIFVRVAVTWYKQVCFDWESWGLGGYCAVQGPQAVSSVTVTQIANLWYGGLYGTIDGPYHGFNVTLPTYSGDHDDEKAMITAVNIGGGSDTTIGWPEVYVKS